MACLLLYANKCADLVRPKSTCADNDHGLVSASG
jgi:hypothetical protein